MKEIYKRFSDLKIDPGITPVHVDDAEKAKVKKIALQRKRKNYVVRNTVVAAALLSISFVTFSITFPAIAAQLPIIGSIFSLFQEESNLIEDYGNYTSEIGITKESNGVQITVTDAVYDGESISIAYTMESEQDLGEEPVLTGEVTVEQYSQSNYTPGRYMTEKIGDRQYAGVFIMYLMTGNKPDSAINVKWEGEEVLIVENRQSSIQGDWQFEFAIEPLESETIELSGLNLIDQGIEVNVHKMTTTPVSNIIYLSHKTEQALQDKWDFVSMDFKVTDNLGNDYEVLPNAGFGGDPYHMSWRIMTPVFDENATSITITPVVTVFNDPNEDMVTFTMKPVDVPLQKK